jgi:hypothetical protein
MRREAELWEFQRPLFADALCLSERVFYMEVEGRAQRRLAPELTVCYFKRRRDAEETKATPGQEAVFVKR